MEPDAIDQLIRLQEIDRVRDRLQRRLDDIPVRLKSHTDRIALLEVDLAEQERQATSLRTEADRAELEVKTREEEREKIKRQMNAPGLGNREYLALQEHLAGVLADINSFSDQALKALTQAEEVEARLAELARELEQARAAYAEARETLEGSLAGVREDLDKRTAERSDFLPGVSGEALEAYERVRRKHRNALAMVEGTIDRAAGRIGNDLHCSACFMTMTANDAVHVLARKKVTHCKSCVRILYVP